VRDRKGLVPIFFSGRERTRTPKELDHRLAGLPAGKQSLWALPKKKYLSNSYHHL